MSPIQWLLTLHNDEGLIVTAVEFSISLYTNNSSQRMDTSQTIHEYRAKQVFPVGQGWGKSLFGIPLAPGASGTLGLRGRMWMSLIPILPTVYTHQLRRNLNGLTFCHDSVSLFISFNKNILTTFQPVTLAFIRFEVIHKFKNQNNKQSQCACAGMKQNHDTKMSAEKNLHVHTFLPKKE